MKIKNISKHTQLIIDKHVGKDKIENKISDLIESCINKNIKLFNETTILLGDKLDDFPNDVNLNLDGLLEDVSKKFNKHASEKRKKDVEIENTNLKNIAGFLDKITYLDFLVNQQEFLNKINQDISSKKIIKKHNVESSRLYPFVEKRKSLTPLCVKSSKNILGDIFELSVERDGIDMYMASMLINDVFDHYRLGMEILHGAPKRIENASYMDTASRDYIDEKVWNFIEIDVCGEKYTVREIKKHRDKIKRQDAQKLARKIKKEIDSDGVKRKTSISRKF